MRIAVYCSAASELPEKWRLAAAELGKWIGRNGHELIYGGVEAGLMKIVADAAIGAGASTVGIVPSRRAHMASGRLSVNIRTSDLSERKRIMLNLAQAFVVLPGGYGTLDELATTFAHLNFTGRRAPIIVYNADGIFNPLIDQFRVMVGAGLMREAMLANLVVVETIGEALESLLNFKKSTEQ